MALSLILSLLLFKPAPVYILDEVDAALDLSHTQVYTYIPQAILGLFIGTFHLRPLFHPAEYWADAEDSFPQLAVHSGVPEGRDVQ